MASKYEGTPLESDWDRIKRKREVNKALIEQMMAPYGGTKMVTGGGGLQFAVDDRLSTGITKIGSALLARYGEKKADAEEEELKERYRKGKDEAIARVTEAMSTTKPYELSPDEQFYENEQIPGLKSNKTPDPNAAAMEFATNPYLQGSDKDLVKAMVFPKYGGSGRSPYHVREVGADGQVFTRDTRDPNAIAEPLLDAQGNPVYDPRSTPSSIYNRGYAGGAGKEKGKDTANLDPISGSAAEAGDVRQAEKDVDKVMNPLIAGDTEASKITGAARGQAEVDYPAAEASYQRTVTLVDELVKHPGMKDVIGFPDNPLVAKGKVWGTDAAGFVARLKQLEGRGFLAIFPTLKGGGTITDTEGAKGQASINRMATATNEEEFIAAAADFKSEMYRLKKLVADRAGVSPGEPPGASAGGRPEGIDKNIWDLMPPEDQALFQ